MADITPIVSLNGELAMPEKVWMQGPPGEAATVTVGTVTTGEPGTDAIVANSGTESAAVFDFTIPRGATGAAGAPGPQGPKGDTGETGPAGAGVPDGGTVGQLLGKTESGTAWIDPPQSGGGGNVPKPLTYDYMPEGYPKKTMETVTIMEDQELAFSLAKGTIYVASLTEALDIAEGQTYTVNWDGTEYECVCFIFKSYPSIGNLSITGAGDDTGEPFIYAYNKNLSSGNFLTFDTSASHTISVKKTEEIITSIYENFLPTGITAAAIENAQTTANAAQTTANAAQTTANAAQSAANTALERVVEPYTRNTQMAPLYKNGGFSAWRGVVQEISYDKTEGYFFANVFDTTEINKEDMPDDNFCVGVYVEDKSVKAFLHCFSDGRNYWGVRGFAVITDGYSQTGEILYVSSNTISPYSAKGLFLTFSAPSSMLLKSSTANRNKQFRITVDDSGTISATEVT